MKLYFKTLTKEERKNIREEYLKSGQAKSYLKANKVILVSFIGLLIAVVSSVFDFIYKSGTLNYILDGLLFMFCLIFFLFFKQVKLDLINKYAVEQKNKK